MYGPGPPDQLAAPEPEVRHCCHGSMPFSARKRRVIRVAMTTATGAFACTYLFCFPRIYRQNTCVNIVPLVCISCV